MQRNDTLIFKQYDSQMRGVARFTPHAASIIRKHRPMLRCGKHRSEMPGGL